VTAVRVLVADDHPQMLAAMVHAVESDGRFAVVGTATNGTDAVRLARELAVEVALVDVRMPAGGPELVAALGAFPRPPAVVAVSADTQVGTVAAIVRAGAVGFLAKGRIGDTLPDVLDRCRSGWVVLGTATGNGALRQLLEA
jgi:two-component system nitrate/nitrite response regulator NarL